MLTIRWTVLALILTFTGLFWSGSGCLGTASASVSVPASTSSPETLTVCPSGCAYSRVQQAIDAAPPGALVQVKPGVYKENLLITKSLTLQGTERASTIIKGTEKGRPVILIANRAPGTIASAGKSEQPLTVTIAELTITAGQGHCLHWPVCADGVLIRDAARVTIRDSVISDNGWGGISVWDTAQVTVERSRLSGNERNHIGLWCSAQATIRDSQLLAHGDDGIVLRDTAQATIQDNDITNNIYGIVLWDSAQATIEHNRITGSDWHGLELQNTSQAIVTDNQVSDNERDGIELRDTAQAMIIHNQISGNGDNGIVLWHSARGSLVNNTISQNGNGILLGRVLGGEKGSKQDKLGKANEGQALLQPGTPLKIWGNTVFGNKDWGIAIYLESCGFSTGPKSFAGLIRGSANRVYDNGHGDLCPPYPGPPWPTDFLTSD